jgi:hypothetical protein
VGIAVGVGAAVARSDSPPIGPLPSGHVSTITAVRGDLVAIALPNGRNGNVWRVARPYDSAVVSEVQEANVGNTVVVVFKARKVGQARVIYALTHGEQSRALAARSFQIRVR